MDWLEYSGQSADELLACEGRYRIDSLVCAFESALLLKKRDRGLSPEEEIVLAVEALEREVNNGGYDQFFFNDSKKYTATIVDALIRIGCDATARITRAAVRAASLTESERESLLRRCDAAYAASTDDIASRLFEFIKANRDKF